MKTIEQGCDHRPTQNIHLFRLCFSYNPNDRRFLVLPYIGTEPNNAVFLCRYAPAVGLRMAAGAQA